MPWFYKYPAVFTLGLLIGLGAMYAALSHHGPDKSLPTTDADVPRHDVTTKKPVQAMDKKTLEDRGAIGKETANDPKKEVTATGQVKTDSGKTTIAAVLNTTDGSTVLTEHRALAEWMNRSELGLGIGVVEGDLAKGAQYRYTFGRVWNFYGTAEVTVFDVDRTDNRHPWNAMLWGTYRW